MSNILRRQDRGSLESMLFVCLSLLWSVSFYEITLIYHLLILVEYSFFCRIWTKPVLKWAILCCLIFLEVLSFNSHKNSLKGKFLWYLTSPKIYAWYALYLVLEIAQGVHNWSGCRFLETSISKMKWDKNGQKETQNKAFCIFLLNFVTWYPWK